LFFRNLFGMGRSRTEGTKPQTAAYPGLPGRTALPP
jgi:hypothetical protein